MQFFTVRASMIITGIKKTIYRILPIGAMIPCTELGAVSASPYKLVDDAFLGLPITNSMVMSWAISLVIILGVRAMIGRPKLIPNAGQAVIENLLGGLRDIMEPIVGKPLIGKVFPLLISLFIFILIQNWSGLLPGVGVFGFYDEHGHLEYWMRPGNADLNMTAALGIIAAVGGWLYFVLRYAGLKTLIFDLFGNKADAGDVGKLMWFLLVPVFMFVGLIEVFSIALRPVSLSVRLFGNVYGGENLITTTTAMLWPGFAAPFYFLELLIGLVQALVFALLTAVYIGLICNHEGGEEH